MPQANLPPVYTYGSALETSSSRFSAPGDFFTYLVFVCSVILVSTFQFQRPDFLLQLRLSFYPRQSILSNLTYLPAQPNLAEAVPEDEEDYPCILHSSIIRNQSKRAVYGVGMVGMSN